MQEEDDLKKFVVVQLQNLETRLTLKLQHLERRMENIEKFIGIQQMEMMSLSQNAQAPICQYYLNGFCRFGDQCKFSHNAPSNVPSNSNKINSRIVLGVDCGGVIIERKGTRGGDTSFFSDDFLSTPAVANSFKILHKAVTKFGRDNVYIVSKCGRVVQKKNFKMDASS